MNKTNKVMMNTKEYRIACRFAEYLDITLNGFAPSMSGNEHNNDENEELLDKIIALGTFASEVAKTVKATRKIDDGRIEGGYRCSAKQSFILARAAVENRFSDVAPYFAK